MLRERMLPRTSTKCILKCTTHDGRLLEQHILEGVFRKEVEQQRKSVQQDLFKRYGGNIYVFAEWKSS